MASIRTKISGFGAVVLMLATIAANAQSTYRAPRGPGGKHDFNGVWQVLNTANYDIEPHAARPAMAVRPGPAGPVPAKPVLALGAVGSVPAGLAGGIEWLSYTR